MDQACANKLRKVFDGPEEIKKVVKCLGSERLHYLFDTTRGLSDKDFLIAVLIEYAGSPRCVDYKSAYSLTVSPSFEQLTSSKAICTKEHIVQTYRCLSDEMLYEWVAFLHGSSVSIYWVAYQ